MTGRLGALVAAGTVLLFLLVPAGSPAAAQPSHGFLGIDCKQAPTPDMPGQGIAGLFETTPSPLPKPADPFAPGSHTTLYAQYGYAGLRWHTYDLGCGPDIGRSPDAVIGTAVSNWVMNAPIAFTALVSSLTEVAFKPTFLNVFDPVISRVSGALHRSLFATWVPAVLALLGLVILFRARRHALATTAAAIGWALIVVLMATALFRWPVAAGHVADGTVTSTLGAVVNGLDGHHGVKPGVSVASSVEDAILYRSWLAGELGSSSSPTARRYGPALFRAQALTWHEASVVQRDPARGQAIIQAKEARWQQIASEIKASDPSAYEYLTGRRSDTRVGYAFVAGFAAFLSLPFLLVSALLLLGSFLIVRLAVMLFPAFATLGVFPAGRGLVTGIGRTVAAAVINSVVFGIGAAITVKVMGLLLDPASRLPGWLELVLMPLFGFIMWVALKPFRRLTTMVSPHHDHFGQAAGSFGSAARTGKRWARKATATAVGVYSGNVAAAATVDKLDADDDSPPPAPDRAEARPTPTMPTDAGSSPIRGVLPPAGSPQRPFPAPASAASASAPEPPSDEPSTPPGAAETAGAPLPPTEPEWVDGEEVYAIYRPPAEEGADDAA